MKIKNINELELINPENYTNITKITIFDENIIDTHLELWVF